MQSESRHQNRQVGRRQFLRRGFANLLGVPSGHSTTFDTANRTPVAFATPADDKPDNALTDSNQRTCARCLNAFLAVDAQELCTECERDDEMARSLFGAIGKNAAT